MAAARPTRSPNPWLVISMFPLIRPVRRPDVALALAGVTSVSEIGREQLVDAGNG